jgi:hypothetical protein
MALSGRYRYCALYNRLAKYFIKAFEESMTLRWKLIKILNSYLVISNGHYNDVTIVGIIGHDWLDISKQNLLNLPLM